MKFIELTKGKVAKVDSDLYESLSKHKWHCSALGYAVRTKRLDNKKKTIWMHREIAKTSVGMVTDHKNGDKLDNRRRNLRTCTHSENNHNKSGKFLGRKGIYFCKTTKKWRARIMVNGHIYEIGRFNSQEDAQERYDTYAKGLLKGFDFSSKKSKLYAK